MNSQNEPYIACKGQIIEESSVEDKQERIDIMEMVVYLSGETTMVFCELELFSRFCPVSQCAWYSVMWYSVMCYGDRHGVTDYQASGMPIESMG